MIVIYINITVKKVTSQSHTILSYKTYRYVACEFIKNFTVNNDNNNIIWTIPEIQRFNVPYS